jgi:hypothetical protein
MTLEEAIAGLKAAKAKSFYDYLKFIRDTKQLCMVQDKGYFWVEFEGESIDERGSGSFTSSEMNDLMMLAGIS